MNRDWFQVSSNIAILAGIGLLVYEPNQANLHARSQNTSFSMGVWQDRVSVVMGEDVSLALAKALDDPQNLTKQELMVLDSYYQHLFSELIHHAYQAQAGFIDANWVGD